jgi:hypothetical protein
MQLGVGVGTPIVLAASDIACWHGSSAFHDNAGTPNALLRLDPHDGSYDWRFVPELGGHFTDEGHGARNPK